MLDLKSIIIGVLFGIALVFVLGASHKKGKIVGMEDENINRGRAEKSRLVGSKRK